jgi:hypothetical protein
MKRSITLLSVIACVNVKKHLPSLSNAAIRDSRGLMTLAVAVAGDVAGAHIRLWKLPLFSQLSSILMIL